MLAMQGPFGGGGGGGMPGMMGMDPQQLQQMMNSPIVQNLLQNPEFLRSMMQSNPALRQVQCAKRTL
jgi:ubiquilin